MIWVIVSMTSQAASEHASVAASLALQQDDCRVGGSLVVGDLGFVVIGVDKTAKPHLQGLTGRQTLDPQLLGGPFNHQPA